MKPNHVAAIVKRFRGFSGSRSTWDAFRDFLELAACTLSNTVDLRPTREEREARYMATIKKYTPEEVQAFPQILALLALALEDEATDVLGRVYMELELGNKWGGQFFTPQCLADVMGAMTFDPEGARAIIAERGYITLSEPAAGGGALVIGMCKAMKAAGFNYTRQLHVTAVDVDEKSAHMTYIQLSLLGVPAVVVHGNSLSLQEWSHWYTPVHVLDGWTPRLRAAERAPAIAPARAVPQLEEFA